MRVTQIRMRRAGRAVDSRTKEEERRQREAEELRRPENQTAAAAELEQPTRPLGKFLHQYRTAAVLAERPIAGQPVERKDVELRLSVEKPTDPEVAADLPPEGRLIVRFRFPEGGEDSLRFAPKDEAGARELIRAGVEVPGTVTRAISGSKFEDRKQIAITRESVENIVAHARRTAIKPFKPNTGAETEFVRAIYHAATDTDAPPAESLLPPNFEVRRLREEAEKALREAEEPVSIGGVRKNTQRALGYD